MSLKLEAPAAPRHSRHGNSLVQKLSKEWNATPGGASQTLYNKVTGLPARFRGLLGDLKRFGAKELAWGFHRGNEQMLREGPHQPVTPLRLALHEEVDSHEDTIRARYAVTRDPSERAALKKALLREIAEKIELFDAICAEEKGDL